MRKKVYHHVSLYHMMMDLMLLNWMSMCKDFQMVRMFVVVMVLLWRDMNNHKLRALRVDR